MRSAFIAASILLIAHASYVQGGIALNYVGGRVCAKCDIVVDKQVVPAHVIIELGLPYQLVVDKEIASSLDIKKNSAIAIKFSESNQLQNLTCQTSDLGELKEFSRLHASELEEIPVCGIVGMAAFDNVPVLLNIQTRNLEYRDAVSPGEGWQAINMTPTELGYFIEVNPAPDYPLQARISTSTYESRIDAACASIAGFPGGDFERYMAGPINIMEFTAVRPVKSETGMGPDAMIGNSFWQNFELVFDPDAKKIWVRKSGRKISDLHEQEYFKALVDEDVDAVERYLDAYPSSRLKEEAIRNVIGQRLGVSPLNKDDVSRAVNRLTGALPPRAAAEQLIGFADTLFEKRQYDANVIPLLLETAKTCCMKTNDAAIFGYEAQARLGRYALLKKDYTQARLYLLSAMFGEPKNPQINYLMGQYYEATGQLFRAWSRYLKATLVDNPPPDAITAISVLNNTPAFRKQFSMANAEEYLEDYLPVNSSEAPEWISGPEVKLIEAFISLTDRACAPIGNAMESINDVNGLILMNYYTGKPKPDLFENAGCDVAIKRYNIKNIPVVAINGKMVDPNLIVSNPLPKKHDEPTPVKPGDTIALQPEIRASARQDGTWVATIPVKNLPPSCHCEIYLVERKCMLISSTAVGMCHNVVRACIFDKQITQADGDVVVGITMDMIQSGIAQYFDAMQVDQNIKPFLPTYVDAAMCYLVAKVYAPDGRLVGISKKDLCQVQDGNDVR